MKLTVRNLDSQRKAAAWHPVLSNHPSNHFSAWLFTTSRAAGRHTDCNERGVAVAAIVGGKVADCPRAIGGKDIFACLLFSRVRAVGAACLASVAVAAVLSGCSLNGASKDAYAPPSVSATSAFVATHDTFTVNARDCSDATYSVSGQDPQFAPKMRSYLADAVHGWSHQAPADPSGTAPADPAGVSGQPGLDLEMRWVNTDPYADMNALTVSVRPVPALVPEPNVRSDTFASDDQQWQAGATTVAKAAQTAVAKAATEAAKVRGYQWPHGRSGISACISALIQDLPPAHDVLLLASDGEENEPPQVAGSLHRAKVLWIMPCTSGNAAHCLALQAQWARFLRKLGASSVTFRRPESASASLFANFMRGA